MTNWEPTVADRRLVDPTRRRRYRATMRNDFLTPRGTPYKWQELTASVDRDVAGAVAPTVVPVRYQWERVQSRTGDPKTAGNWREWTFARGQSFRSVLLHTDLAGDAPATTDPDMTATMDVRYPQLPKAPAVDLLLMVSWDVITFEMMATHLITTPGLRTVGSAAEVRGISGTWADLTFSDPGAVAAFHNAQMYGRNLGFGRFAGRTCAVYSTQCLDCKIDVRSGPVTQRGRSSYWVTVQVDAETGDLLSAEMTEMIVATLTGQDGQQVPVQKRRSVRMWADLDAAAPDTAATDPAAIDPAVLVEAAELAERVSGHVRWQAASLEKLPQGAADLAVMGFRSMVGADSTEVYRQVRALRNGLKAMADGDPAARGALYRQLPAHRRQLEGLLAFGQVAVDEATRLGVRDEPGRRALHDYLVRVRGDLTDLLAVLDRVSESPAAVPGGGSAAGPPAAGPPAAGPPADGAPRHDHRLTTATGG
ncbi:hypothetical protein ACN27F_06795 [Solwaraspora sp. WMMB335]|uniref:hypothetical protein n=1 Tax=Solwaraspora sp. WMMB335 TaxID=3404118 RepID=UPI003B94E5C0